MSIYIRILLIIGACSLLLFMLKKIRQSKLKIEYVVFWFCFSSILVLMVFLIIIFILIVKLFFNTIQMSALENKVDSLAQQIAIDRKIDHDVKNNEEN